MRACVCQKKIPNVQVVSECVRPSGSAVSYLCRQCVTPPPVINRPHRPTSHQGIGTAVCVAAGPRATPRRGGLLVRSVPCAVGSAAPHSQSPLPSPRQRPQCSHKALCLLGPATAHRITAGLFRRPCCRTCAQTHTHTQPHIHARTRTHVRKLLHSHPFLTRVKVHARAAGAGRGAGRRVSTRAPPRTKGSPGSAVFNKHPPLPRRCGTALSRRNVFSRVLGARAAVRGATAPTSGVRAHTSERLVWPCSLDGLWTTQLLFGGRP